MVNVSPMSPGLAWPARRRRADEQRLALADRYRIEREIGRGGVAVVYLAYDLRRDCRPDSV